VVEEDYHEERCSNLLFNVFMSRFVPSVVASLLRFFPNVTKFLFKMFHHQKFGRRFRGECGKKFTRMFPTNLATGYVVMCLGKLRCEETETG
jgi:hypothetical protein